jgi:acetyl/propionyl-CoA carboxylase alpha subunit
MNWRTGDRTLTVSAALLPDGTLRVTLPDGTERTVRACRLPGGVLEVADGDRVFRVPTAARQAGGGGSGGVTLGWQGASYVFTPEAAAAGGRGSASRPHAAGALTAPMVGVVADVLAAVGDTVEAFAPLVVVEAMKVLARVETPRAGVVRAVHVRKGDRVEHGQLLIEVEPPAEQESPAPS